VKKDSHVAWNVEYAPGSIEARGWKDGKQVMTARRDTTGAAAKLALRPDRESLSADGEDVAMFAVEVQDANGRTIPITDNLVTFTVTGPAKLIGVGNGDPTDHSPDKGTSRKAFSGYCMALVQTEKTPGTITVEATSSGLTGASATVSSKQVELRPQVSLWQRPIPKGAGITGLWDAVSDPGTGLAASALGSPRIFTLTEKGGKLTGTVEGPGGWFGGDDAPVPIHDGVVDGNHVSFKSGINAFDGKIKGAELELQRTVNIPFSLPATAKAGPQRARDRPRARWLRSLHRFLRFLRRGQYVCIAQEVRTLNPCFKTMKPGAARQAHRKELKFRARSLAAPRQGPWTDLQSLFDALWQPASNCVTAAKAGTATKRSIVRSTQTNLKSEAAFGNAPSPPH